MYETDLDNDTSLTSDVLIYNALIKAAKDNPLLKIFKIDYPSENALAEESNTIFVASVDDEITKQTMNAEFYNALTEIFVKTKKTNYKEASMVLRTVIKVIKKVLREDESLGMYKPVFRKSASNYGSKFALKGRNVLVQTKERDLFDVKDIEIEKVCEILIKNDEEGAGE
jgi:hypothetical protein